MTTIKYKIIEFDDGMEMVPITWMAQNNTKVWWPPYRNQIKINKAISKMEYPDKKTWGLCDVLKHVAHAESYDLAVEKLKMAQDVSDVENVTAEQYKRGRQIRAKLRPSIIDSSDSVRNTGEDRGKQLPPFPKPPISVAKSIPKTKPRIIESRLIAHHQEYHSDDNNNNNENGNSMLTKAKQIADVEVHATSTTQLTRTPSSILINHQPDTHDAHDNLQLSGSPKKTIIEQDSSSDSDAVHTSPSPVATNKSKRKEDNGQSSTLSHSHNSSVAEIIRKINSDKSETIELAYMKEIIHLLSKVLVNQEEIKKDLRARNSTIDIPAKTNDKSVDLLKVIEILPLKSEDDLKNFENQLKNETFKSSVVLYC